LGAGGDGKQGRKEEEDSTQRHRDAEKKGKGEDGQFAGIIMVGD
jgi:hypothetical protein